MAIIYASVNLHCQENGSDKVYNIVIEEDGALYTVNFEYGRRGSTLNVGTKTSSRVDLTTAVRIFDKLINEKLAKGYKSIAGNPVNTPVIAPKTSTGIYPMLLTPIDEDEVEHYLESDDWIMQEKLDGERRLLKILGGLVTGINRKGQVTALPANLEHAAANLSKAKLTMILDGEQIGDDFYVFDVLGESTQSAHAFKLRYKTLVGLMDKAPKNSFIHLVKTAEGFADKSKLYEKLQADNKEGIVFKHKDGLYTPGRTQQALKYKFYETASFVVSAINAQRSVQIAVMAGDAQLPVGNVTILPNFPVPKLGAVIEVRYLYAYQGGSVYQPVYLGERNDISPSDCSMSQLKYKSNISLI